MRRWLNEHCELWPYKALFAILLIGALGLLASLFGREVLLSLLVLPVPGAVWLFVRRWNQRAERLRLLGKFHASHGDYTGAESLYRQALAIDEKTFGEDHPCVSTDLTNLGDLYCSQGNYAAAESLYKRELAIVESARGPDHPDVATSLNTLGELYEAMGAHSAAETMYQWGLAIWEEALASDHPAVTRALTKLALQDGTQARDAVPDPFI